MVLISLLPIGLIQSWASVTQGLWLARSEDFTQQPLLQNLRWLLHGWRYHHDIGGNWPSSGKS
ncbi:MAG: hypothetical protein ACLUPK_09325 [Veillonella sp.]